MTRHLRRHLEMERLFGSDFLPVHRDTETQRSEKKPPDLRGVVPPGPVSEPAEFAEFREKVLACTKCGLCQGRTQVVFGTGPLGAPLMFVGEAPGEDEDRQGEPFVGRAGQLLTKSLLKLGVERRRVYIANILKCRPPGNRSPQPDEMTACIPYLLKQLQFVKPKIVAALGNVAAQTLLGTRTGITQLRGRTHEAHGVKILPIFHPAYVLRNMGELRLFETDLARACRDAGLVS